MIARIPALQKLQEVHLSEPRATRTNINAALAAESDLTLEKLREVLDLSALELKRIGLMRDVLNDDELGYLVSAGQISFGMIKPHREEAIDVKGTDEEVATMVLESIRPPLEVTMHQPIWIPTTVSREFYVHLAGLDEGRVLDRVSGFMSSGASTALVLHHEDGDAINQWRQQTGTTRAHQNPEEAHTLRHRFQTSQGVGNNVVHGSDNIESVQRELQFMDRMLGVLSGKN